MSLIHASLNDASDAFGSSITVVSPNTRYVVCNDFAGTTSLADVSGTLTLVWSAALSYSGHDVIAEAVDDAGDVWGYDGLADFNLIKVPKGDHIPVVGYTWSYTGGSPVAENGYVDKVFTFTMPDASILLVVTIGGDGTHYYTATKGVGSTLTEHSTTFSAIYAFQDKNGDVWIAGTPTSSSLKMLRITNVASSSYPNTVQTYTIPDYTNGSGEAFTPPEIAGAVQADNFVAAWPAQGLNGSPFTQHLMQVPLAGGSVTTSDITSTSVIFPMVSSSNADFKQTFNANLGTIYVQYESTLLDNFDGDIFTVGRTFTAVDLATMAFGATYDLGDWAAGDTGDGGRPTQVESNVYLASINAFAGTRFQDPSSDLFVYYIGGGTAGAVSTKSWGFSLDGHDFYVLPSVGLVYDITTGQWSEWINNGLTRFRPCCGQNWQGMATSLTDGGTDIVGGDDTTGILWRLDPTKGRDDLTTTGDETFPRVVTGGISLDGRDAVACNAVELTLALGNPSQTGAALTLQTSDDLGNTWLNHGSVTVVAGDYDGVVEWRSLGTMTAPGRIFRISDDGATVRIGRADIR